MFEPEQKLIKIIDETLLKLILKPISWIFTARKRSLRRLCFYRCLSVHRGEPCVVASGGGCVVAQGGVHGCSSGGACMVALGGWGEGACMVAPMGGMHGCSRGHVWLLWGGMRGCSQGGMHGCSQGVCVVAPRGACVVAPRGACMGYDEIRRYNQWAGGTHPTGMHSCYLVIFIEYLCASCKILEMRD